MLDQERFDIYIDSLSAELPEPLGALEQEALAAGVPIIRKATQSLLAFLLVKDQPKRILEIGTAVGFSALFMKAHLPKDARITTIEKVEMRLVEARKNLEAYDPEGAIALVEGEAQEILNRLAKEQPGRRWYAGIRQHSPGGGYFGIPLRSYETGSNHSQPDEGVSVYSDAYAGAENGAAAGRGRRSADGTGASEK